MRQRTRKGIYYAFTACFIVIGTYLVFITQGLVIDWENLRVVKTGGIYLKFAPSDAAVFINEKLQNISPGFISRGVFIKDLAPKEYSVKVTKDGYYDWEKDMKVLSGIVTQASSIKLWEKEPKEKNIASSSIENFWVTRAGIITQTKERGLLIGAFPMRGKIVTDSDPEINSVITKDNKGNLFFIDLNNPNAAINIHEIFNSLKKREIKTSTTTKIDYVGLHPFSAGKIIIAAKNSLYSLDLKKIKLEKIAAASSSVHIVATGSEIFSVDKSGNATGINLLTGTQTSLKIASTSINAVSATKSGSRFFTLDSKKELYLFERATVATSTLSKNVKSFFTSPDEKKIAIVSDDNTIKILYVEEETGDIKIPKGTTLSIIVPHIDPRKNVRISWVPKFGNYILISDGENLLVAEIDSRPPQNTHPLFTKIKEYTLTNTLYVLREDGALSAIEL